MWPFKLNLLVQPQLLTRSPGCWWISRRAFSAFEWPKAWRALNPVCASHSKKQWTDRFWQTLLPTCSWMTSCRPDRWPSSNPWCCSSLLRWPRWPRQRQGKTKQIATKHSNSKPSQRSAPWDFLQACAPRWTRHSRYPKAGRWSAAEVVPTASRQGHQLHPRHNASSKRLLMQRFCPLTHKHNHQIQWNQTCLELPAR